MKPVYSKAVAKAIGGMDNATKQRIKAAIEKLPEGDIKPLQGYGGKTHRLRVGGYRVVFRYETDEEGVQYPFIMEMDSRGDIYK